MDQEMKLEMTRQREELNTQLEEAMEKELEVSAALSKSLSSKVRQIDPKSSGRSVPNRTIFVIVRKSKFGQYLGIFPMKSSQMIKCHD